MEVIRTNTHYRGISTVEAALVFPVLLMLTLGIIHYGWLFLKAQQITHAARHGARIAILPDANDLDVEAAIDSLMADAGISGYETGITGISGGRGAPVTVSLSVDVANVALFNNVPFLPDPNTLSASVTMAKEGP